MDAERNTIIAVDDNLENLNALKNTLKDIYRVFPVPSAFEMFNLLEHIQPDLILLDIEMPEMNGYETIKKLKSDDKYRDIPIIFLTSMSDEQSEMEGLKLGAVDYIHKPFVTPLLLQRIKTHLSLMEQQKMILDRNKEIEELLEIKTKEGSLRQAAELEAQNASRAKGEFLSHMSHEIRSPLNAVIGMINIATEANDVQTIKRHLEKAGNASKYVMGVINDILDMSKIEADKLELSFNDFNFGRMVSNIVDVTSIRAQEKHQQLIVNINANIPQFVISDELRLSQVITNLMTNAIKFTPEKGKIELNAEKLEEQNDEITLRVEVVDSGIGISPEQQKKLFTSYNQADNTITKNFGGTGLGLAISKRIVELMQGRIWIESELGKGSKFIFTIKAKKGNADKVTTGSTAKSDENEFDFKNYLILVAEDMEFNRIILAKYLEKTGIAIDFVENGKAAVSTFKENPDKYNLILMDINMPEMNGDEATRLIRAFESELKDAGNSHKQTPIIAMTADVFKEDIEKCLAAGMTDHVAKPIVPKKICATLKRYLG
jgi:two-component system, sensor histidine kinase and response regulator